MSSSTKGVDTAVRLVSFPAAEDVPTDWSHIGYGEDGEPTLESGDPVHWGLTVDEQGSLEPFTEGLSPEQVEDLHRVVVGIASTRGQVALDEVVEMAAANEAPFGLAAEAFIDENSRFGAACYAEEWVHEVRQEVGGAHFGCW